MIMHNLNDNKKQVFEPVPSKSKRLFSAMDHQYTMEKKHVELKYNDLGKQNIIESEFISKPVIAMYDWEDAHCYTSPFSKEALLELNDVEYVPELLLSAQHMSRLPRCSSLGCQTYYSPPMGYEDEEDIVETLNAILKY
jgi:hypothetical protein